MKPHVRLLLHALHAATVGGQRSQSTRNARQRIRVRLRSCVRGAVWSGTIGGLRRRMHTASSAAVATAGLPNEKLYRSLAYVMQPWCVRVTYTRQTSGNASRAESDSQQAARLPTPQVLSQALLGRSRSTDTRTTQLYGRMVCPHHFAAAAAVQMGVTVAGSVSYDEVPESDSLAGHSFTA